MAFGKKKTKTTTSSKKIVKDLDATARPWKDRVCPSVLEFDKTSFMLEMAYCTVYSIYNYPTEVGMRWLRPLSLIEGTMVCIFNEEANRDELLKNIDFSIREESIRREAKINKEVTAAIDAQSKIDNSMALSQRLLEENVNVGRITIYIIVFAESQKQLDVQCRDVESRIAARHFTIRRIPNLMPEGFDSFMPIAENKYGEMNSIIMPLDVFYAGMGIVPSFGINDPTGLYLGYDKSANPVFLDVWKKANGRSNANMAIMGKSGSGKSALTKTLLIHELVQGTKLLILDPEREYLSLADYFDGNIIDPSGGTNKDGTQSIINPLQLTDFPDIFDEKGMTKEKLIAASKSPTFRGTVTMKIGQLNEWFKTYLVNLNENHLSLIQEALYETYKRKGCTELSDPRKMKNTDHPIIADLGAVLKERAAACDPKSWKASLYEELLLQMYPVLEGSERSMFNGYTNIDLSNPFTVFDVSNLLNMKDNVKNAQFSNITSYMWLAMTKNRDEKCILAVDEAHLFINEKSTATFEFLGQLCKRTRKYGSALWVTTQNIQDFLAPSVARYGAGILNNCAMRMLMKSDADDLEKLCAIFDLNDGEQSLIKTAGIGQGLLIAGDMRVFADVDIEPNVLKLCQMGGGK